MEQGFISYHLYYHESLDLATTEFLGPTVAGLLRRGAVDRFFFIRYYLGGPHLRLRLRARPGREGEVRSAVESAAAELFTRRPSGRSLPEETIAKANEAILAADPGEGDASIYPDNSLRVLPYRPEVDRYGGPDLLEYSVSFFTVSSVAAVGYLARHAGRPRARRMAEAFRLLLRQALGYALDRKELTRLLGYGVESWGRSFPTIEEKAEAVFDRDAETLCELFRYEADLLCTDGKPGTAGELDGSLALGEAAAALAGLVGGRSRGLRQGIGGSHLHMTANRLGLRNAEEVYLSRLLLNATGALAGSLDGLWSGRSANGSSAQPTARPDNAKRLEDCVTRALDSSMWESVSERRPPFEERSAQSSGLGASTGDAGEP